MNEPPGSETRVAGFWIRVAALAIDLVLFALVKTSFGGIGRRVGGAEAEDSALFQLTVVVFTVVFTGVYTTVLHAAGGQTLGKMLVGIRVVAADGGAVPAGAALLRYFAYFASVATLLGGYAMAGLRRDKRALHDLIAGTRVERVPRQRRVAAAPADEWSPSSPA